MAILARYAATIGFFDGVHTGHQSLLAQLRQTAHRQGLDAMVVTFREHPREVLTGERVPLLTTLEERLQGIREAGIEQVVVLDFATVRGLTALQFLQLLKQEYGVDLLLMGYNHRFGADRLTRYEDYVAVGAEVGVRIEKADERLLGAGKISSTLIRRAIMAGDIALAQQMLGHAYLLTGEVVRGKQIGRQIGFPTANVQVDERKILPSAGVYAAQCRIDEEDRIYKALLNIGTNPTVGGKTETIEAYLIGFEGDIYGRVLHVEVLQKIRDEQRFESLEDLQKQIQQDLSDGYSA